MLQSGPLLERFEYDLWANTAWLGCLRDHGFPEPESTIFRHILASEQGWLNRCRLTSYGASPELPLEEGSFSDVNEQWRHFLALEEEDRIVEYERPSGERVRLRVSQIIGHVLNHATYHRGEIRGLFLARDEEDFPETDFTKFLFEKGLNQ
jgi:uncharacterized damage-inducible protein DinB